MNRRYEIDVLKFLGLILVILAHVNCDSVIFLLRSFDVPLMVFASGVAFAGKTTFPKFKEFCIRRVLRLVLPVIIFLTGYFCISYIMGHYYSVETILRSYLMLDGIGYVWIIRVFLLLMIITPALCKSCSTYPHRSGLIITIGFIFYDILMIQYNEIMPRIIRAYIPYMFGYGIVFSVAVVYVKSSIRWKVINSIIWAFLTLMFIVMDRGFNPYDCKYPPHGLYIAYGILCSIILLNCCYAGKSIVRRFCNVYHLVGKVKSILMRVITYVSSHSIWIYLWHIPILALVFSWQIDSWLVRWILVFLFALITFIIQRKIIRMVVNKIPNSRINNFLINYLTK